MQQSSGVIGFEPCIPVMVAEPEGVSPRSGTRRGLEEGLEFAAVDLPPRAVAVGMAEQIAAPSSGLDPRLLEKPEKFNSEGVNWRGWQSTFLILAGER